MPRNQKNKSPKLNSTLIQFRINATKAQYTDLNLRNTVGKHLSKANVTLSREEWLWADTLHTQILLGRLTQKGVLNNLFMKNESGLVGYFREILN